MANDTVHMCDYFFKTVSTTSIIIATIYSFCGILAVTGNIFNITVVCKSHIIRSPTGLLLANLAFADAAYGFFALLMSGPPTYLNCWPYNQVFLQTAGLCFWAIFSESMFIISAIAIERYLSLTSKTWHQKLFFKKGIVVFTVVSWIFNLSNQAIGFAVNGNEFIYDIASGLILREYNVLTPLYLLICYLMPITIIFITYSKIVRIILKHKREIHPHGEEPQPSTINSDHGDNETPRNFPRQHSQHIDVIGTVKVRLIKVFLFLTAMSVLTVTPSVIIAFLRQFNVMNLATQRVVLPLCTILLYLNPIANCVIYNVTIKSFRTQMIRILTCKKQVEEERSDVEFHTFELTRHWTNTSVLQVTNTYMINESKCDDNSESTAIGQEQSVF